MLLKPITRVWVIGIEGSVIEVVIDVVDETEGKEDADNVEECFKHDGSFQRGLMVLIIRRVKYAIKAYNPCMGYRG